MNFKGLVNAAYTLIALSFSYQCSANTIKLDGSSTLSVSTNQNKVTSVVLRYEKRLQESFNIGNSMTGQVKHISLCRSCKKLFLIAIPDASSTFGHQTLIIVFPESHYNWGIQKLPISAKLLNAQNSDSYLLEYRQNYYEFKDGLLDKINYE